MQIYKRTNCKERKRGQKNKYPDYTVSPDIYLPKVKF